VTEPGVRDETGWRWLGASLTALASALLSMLALVSWLRTGPLYDGHAVLVASYLVVWLPFIAAVAFVSFVRGSRSLVRDTGLRITALDVFVGVGAGLLSRAAAGVVEIAVTGRLIGLGVTFGETVYDGWWLFGMIIAPVLIAPFFEELFFRGLFQRAVLRTASGRASPRVAITISIVTSATLFALLHLTQAANPTGALVLGLSSLILGLAVALIAGLTGRIGGAIVAHVVFNGSLVLTSFM
jgi:membrane protease YdiL (CAAX protease family)